MIESEPSEVARQVEACPLRLDRFRPDRDLRGYQLFGAKFILTAGRSILGDEMGLGKTVEALAAMAHLAALEPNAHFLVACPAGAVANWAGEVGNFTSLPVHVLYGPARDRAFERWRRKGGVAVTSYGSLRSLECVGELPPVALFVADEAHQIKNPRAERTWMVRRLVERISRVCFMSGTPLENRVQEFRHLAEMIQPEVAARIPMGRYGETLLDPKSFRKAAAGIYLRRNQEDVLHELPEKIEVEEWVDLDHAQRSRYRQAMLSRNEMALRQAVTISAGGGRSPKVARLEEILETYRESGEKVVVFSFFRSVLDEVARAVPSVGRITGGVPSQERLHLIERLRDAPAHAVLLAQIEAGGLALNIQAASVVVLMEPQWKPSTERQAIARVHRMGQPRRVKVHRLLARDTVDEKYFTLVRSKQEVFDDHVRESPLKDASPDAMDTAVAVRTLEEEYVRAVRDAYDRGEPQYTAAA